MTAAALTVPATREQAEARSRPVHRDGVSQWTLIDRLFVVGIGLAMHLVIVAAVVLKAVLS